MIAGFNILPYPTRYGISAISLSELTMQSFFLYNFLAKLKPEVSSLKWVM